MNRDAFIEKMTAANLAYAAGAPYSGDVSIARRTETEKGEKPYAVVIACSDSRVVPEAIFNAGIGELFVIRVAGNVVGEAEEASVSYAIEHLHVQHVIVLGHTKCGAIQAALDGESDEKAGYLVRRIQKTIGTEKDPMRACILNVEENVRLLRSSFSEDERHQPLDVIGAVYDISGGKVTFLS